GPELLIRAGVACRTFAAVDQNVLQHFGLFKLCCGEIGHYVLAFAAFGSTPPGQLLGGGTAGAGAAADGAAGGDKLCSLISAARSRSALYLSCRTPGVLFSTCHFMTLYGS